MIAKKQASFCWRAAFGCLLIFFALPVLAQDSETSSDAAAAFSPPTIIKHSKNLISIYQGDKLELAMETAGPAGYRWTMDGRVLCEKSICAIDCERWPPGKYSILAAAMNKNGSQQFEYKFRIVPRPSNIESKTVRPNLEIAQNVETLGEGDKYIQALGGLSFLRSRSKGRAHHWPDRQENRVE